MSNRKTWADGLPEQLVDILDVVSISRGFSGGHLLKADPQLAGYGKDRKHQHGREYAIVLACEAFATDEVSGWFGVTDGEIEVAQRVVEATNRRRQLDLLTQSLRSRAAIREGHRRAHAPEPVPAQLDDTAAHALEDKARSAASARGHDLGTFTDLSTAISHERDALCERPGCNKRAFIDTDVGDFGGAACFTKCRGVKPEDGIDDEYPPPVDVPPPAVTAKKRFIGKVKYEVDDEPPPKLPFTVKPELLPEEPGFQVWRWFETFKLPGWRDVQLIPQEDAPEPTTRAPVPKLDPMPTPTPEKPAEDVTQRLGRLGRQLADVKVEALEERGTLIARLTQIDQFLALLDQAAALGY